MNFQLPILFLTSLLFVSNSVFAACTAGTLITLDKPDNHYLVHANGTVTDVASGLMWKQCSEGQVWSAGACTGSATTHNWSAAMGRPATNNAASGTFGYTDWRMPNVKELNSIVDRSCTGTLKINITIFPSSQSAAYWTSSPYTLTAANAWNVNFSNGVENNAVKTAVSYVRLVRGTGN